MGISSSALYLNLIEDLSGYLPGDTIDALLRDGKASPWPDMTFHQYSALALANSFLKKYQDMSTVDADAVAMDKFLNINLDCQDWSLKLENSGDELLYGEFKLAVYNFLYPNQMPLVSNFSQILDLGRAGPGTSLKAQGTDFYTKMFSSSLSSTSESLYDAYVRHFDNLPGWSLAENLRQATFGEVEVVAGNRLSFVPKNADTSRTICTEPSLNMFYQLGLGALLERRLRQFFGIDLALQPDRNRELARIGSLDNKEDRSPRLDGLVTIDLSSASDSISLPMLESVLPRDFLSWLKLLRSPQCDMPNGSSIPLNMVSTMGNGFTFPLQTMLFGCAVLAAERASYREVIRPSSNELGSFGVFGDDIICGKFVYRRVVRLLNILGFQVNHEKSFYEGPFRESCGSDFFRGRNVRGVYVKTLKTTQARYAVINQLNLWTGRIGIPLPRTVGRLVRSVRYLPVPVWENDDAGIRMPYYLLPGMSRSSRYQSLAYKRWCVRPRRLKVGDGIVSVPRGEKRREYNAHGLMLAFLRGSIEQGYITVRQRTVLYSQRTGVAPNWDATPTGPALPAGVTLSNFGFSVAINLGL
jgi:hypothetical protein